jgi:hypothetical protein
MALKRVAVAYKDKIPDYEAKAKEFGIENIPSSQEKDAEVIKSVSEDSLSTFKPRGGRKSGN